MKRLIKTSIALVLLFTTVLSAAADQGTSLSNSFDHELPFNKVKKGQELQIKNASGRTIYSESIMYDGQVEGAFDLKTFKDGFYTMELINCYEISIKKFAILDRTITYLENGETTIYKPVFRMKKNKILISHLDFNSNEWDVNLFFNNEVIHSETIAPNPILERVYVLGENVKGDYKVVLKNADRLYEGTFKN